jgi:hypothetical protein
MPTSLRGLLKSRWFMEGAGATMLLLVTYLWPLLSPYHLIIYHNPLSVSTVAIGLAVDVGIAWLISTAMFALLDHYDPKQDCPLWGVVFCALGVRAVDLAVFLLSPGYINIHWGLSSRIALLCTMGGVALTIRYLFPQIFRQGIQTARIGLAIFGGSIFWILPQLVFTGERTRAPAPNTFTKPVHKSSISSARVVWILLDELSYDQVFDHPQADIKLSHFDKIRDESVSFSNVQPIGYFTERIVPSLFLGRKVDNIRSSMHRDLYVHDADSGRWQPFNQRVSLFGKAKELGWTTGVAGWYNPYCHILAGVLDSCYWQTASSFPHALSGDKSSIVNALTFPADLFFSHLNRADPPSEIGAKAHAQECNDITAAASSLIQNESIRFAFIHLPVPHPPGMYDRKTGTFGVRGTYLDNLVSADSVLGNLLAVIQRTSAASQTILIVSSDHSWRTNMWRASDMWSKDEERASKSKFDPRPVLLIHFPGYDPGEVRTEPFPEIETSAIIRAMLTSELQSKADLDMWLDAQGVTKGQNLSPNPNIDDQDFRVLSTTVGVHFSSRQKFQYLLVRSDLPSKGKKK